MIRRFATILAAFAIASSAVSALAVRLIDSFISFVFSAVSPRPEPAFAMSNEGWVGHAYGYHDPLVERHEAGTSRRSAARGT